MVQGGCRCTVADIDDDIVPLPAGIGIAHGVQRIGDGAGEHEPEAAGIAGGAELAEKALRVAAQYAVQRIQRLLHNEGVPAI